MPESKSRKAAETKKKVKEADKLAERRSERERKARVAAPTSRRWVPVAFIVVGLLGVAWLITYYLTSSAGVTVPFMSDLRNWNILIGMGLMAASFVIATLWK
ncbi:cell division protein CrgA [Propionibacteriaceae bacterium Y1685]|uniref:cell division protein CrgA n=1 Tax=Microlunatus sp. Y1700 TaxID=3418487 RepID=UPI003B795B20